MESVLDRRRRKGQKAEYLVKWEGFPHSENSWEPLDVELGSGIEYEVRPDTRAATFCHSPPSHNIAWIAMCLGQVA